MNKPNLNSLSLCSKAIRSSFLDYFSSQGHRIVKSSPVVPYSDNSLAFVNAGMCQFKNIFLGKCAPPYPRVANSQKCIRVGGKHDDLSCAGRDSYHHTFFEMLGNWSFSDYHKKEACRMTLEFLTQSPICLPMNRLYFTYFGGNATYNLPCDEETRAIWLELGVPETQIKKEGMRANFWEMGATGPCGYSSEIHFDLKNDPKSALSRVNHDFPDLIEIWNIVFISHNRINENTILPLSKNYIDTGLGFERLVTILQQKTSTYDTDLFSPLVATIGRVSGAAPYGGNFTNKASLDTNYRILSDYSRMITVALSDNMFPDATAKLRNIVRDALVISEDVFRVKQGKLLKELSYNNAEILGETYPEIRNNLNKVQLILSEEARIFDNLRSGAVKEWRSLLKTNPELSHLNIMEEPGLVQGVKYLNKHPPVSEISGNLAFTLYDTYGLSKNIIEDIATAKKLQLNKSEFESRLQQLKMESKGASDNHLVDIEPSCLGEISVTNDLAKYDYTFDHEQNRYVFPMFDNNVTGVVLGGQAFCVSPQGIHHATSRAKIDSIRLEGNSAVGLVFDATNFYTQAGGQTDDKGVVHLINEITKEVARVSVDKIIPVEGKLIHLGTIDHDFTLTPEVKSRMEVNADHRIGCMRAHTTSHIINEALRQTLTCTYQKSCRVACDIVAFDFSVYGETLSLENLASVEQFLRDVISKRLDVSRRQVEASDLCNLSHVTIIPGETYPDDVTLIEILDTNNDPDFQRNSELGTDVPSGHVLSREPCCGTHVHNTGHIQAVCLLNYKSYNHGVRSIKCLTGNLAEAAMVRGEGFKQECTQLSVNVNITESEETLKRHNESLKQLKLSLLNEAKLIPYVARKQCEIVINELGKTLKLKLRTLKRTKIITELSNVITANPSASYYVQYIRDDDIEVQALPPLSEIQKPVMLIVHGKGELFVRCYVPIQYANEVFTAEAWMTSIQKHLNAKASRNVDGRYLYSLNTKLGRDVQLDKVVDIAKMSAEKLTNA